jgi:hypothetical protein
MKRYPTIGLLAAGLLISVLPPATAAADNSTPTPAASPASTNTQDPRLDDPRQQTLQQLTELQQFMCQLHQASNQIQANQDGPTTQGQLMPARGREIPRNSAAQCVDNGGGSPVRLPHAIPAVAKP